MKLTTFEFFYFGTLFIYFGIGEFLWVLFKAALLFVARARCLCPSLGTIYVTDCQLQHHRDEAEEYRHDQDTYHCGSHWWELPWQFLAWGISYTKLRACFASGSSGTIPLSTSLIDNFHCLSNTSKTQDSRLHQHIEINCTPCIHVVSTLWKYYFNMQTMDANCG